MLGPCDLRIAALPLVLVGASGTLGCAGADAGAGLGVRLEELRPTDPSASGARFAAGEVVETHGSPGGEFLVHYTRAGANAVPDADLDTSGVPDFVESVAATYDEALAYYRSAGFRDPLSDLGAPGGDGGDGRFDVYLVDFAGIGDGAFRRDGCLAGAPSQCFGHMAQDEEFEGYPVSRRAEAIRILAAHELFHAIQAAYDADQSAIFSEGSAVWASEAFDPALQDLDGFSGAYLTMTNRSLDVATTPPGDNFTYGSGVVFLFLTERYGPDVVRTLLEDLEDGARGVTDPEWIPALDALLARDHSTSWADALDELAEWCLYTGARADPTVAFARGESLALLGTTEVDPPFSDDRVRLLPSSINAYLSVPLGRSTMTAAIVPTLGSDDATAISMVVARLGSGTVREVVHAGDPTRAPSLSMAAGDVFVVLLVRGNDVATSHTPGVCIGSPSEVSACVDALTPRPDAGTPDAGAVLDDASVDGDAGPAAPAPSGCACRTGAGGRSTHAALGAALTLAAVLGRARIGRRARGGVSRRLIRGSSA